MCKPLRPKCRMGPLESSLCLRRSHRRLGYLNMDLLVFALLRLRLLALVLCRLARKSSWTVQETFLLFNLENNKGKFIHNVSFPCPFRTTRSLRARA